MPLQIVLITVKTPLQIFKFYCQNNVSQNQFLFEYNIFI